MKNYIVNGESGINVSNENFTTLMDIKQVNGNDWSFIRIVKAFGHKFKFCNIYGNGDPIGFKNNKCVSVFVPELGQWKEIADCYGVGGSYDNDYYGNELDHRISTEDLFTLFYNYIEMLYTD